MDELLELFGDCLYDQGGDPESAMREEEFIPTFHDFLKTDSAALQVGSQPIYICKRGHVSHRLEASEDMPYYRSMRVCELCKSRMLRSGESSESSSNSADSYFYEEDDARDEDNESAY